MTVRLSSTSGSSISGLSRAFISISMEHPIYLLSRGAGILNKNLKTEYQCEQLIEDVIKWSKECTHHYNHYQSNRGKVGRFLTGRPTHFSQFANSLAIISHDGIVFFAGCWFFLGHRKLLQLMITLRRIISGENAATYDGVTSLAGEEGLEPSTYGFGDRCSAKLSYSPSISGTRSGHKWPFRLPE